MCAAAVRWLALVQGRRRQPGRLLKTGKPPVLPLPLLLLLQLRGDALGRAHTSGRLMCAYAKAYAPIHTCVPAHSNI